MRTLLKKTWGAEMWGERGGKRVQVGAVGSGLEVPAFFGFNVQQKRAWRKHGIVRID